jgi:hypothetical protein
MRSGFFTPPPDGTAGTGAAAGAGAKPSTDAGMADTAGAAVERARVGTTLR